MNEGYNGQGADSDTKTLLYCTVTKKLKVVKLISDTTSRHTLITGMAR